MKSQIKDELAREPRPTTINSLIEKTVRIDNRLFERRLEKSDSLDSMPFRRQIHQFKNNRPNNRPFRPNQNQHSNRQFTPPNRSFQQSNGPIPMDLDSLATSKLTIQERNERLAKNLCLYCGKPGHRVQDCFKAGNKNSNLQNRQPFRSSNTANATSFNNLPQQDSTISFSLAGKPSGQQPVQRRSRLGSKFLAPTNFLSTKEKTTMKQENL